MSARDLSRYRAEREFQHTFENVKERTDIGYEISSESFYVRGLSFKLVMESIYSVSNDTGKEIRCDLRCMEVEKIRGFSCKIKTQFFIVRPGMPLLALSESPESFTLKYPTPSNVYNKDLAIFLNGEGGLVDDKVTIKIAIWADEPEGGSFEPPKKKTKFALQPVESQVQGEAIVSLLDSGEGADVTFVIKEDSSRIKAHKLILSCRSPVFAAMLGSNMKESQTKEVTIDDMGHTSLKTLLHHIYSWELGFPKDLEVNANVCKELVNAANKYNLSNLKEYAGMALTEFINYENALEMGKFVKIQGADAATKSVRSFVIEHIGQIFDSL